MNSPRKRTALWKNPLGGVEHAPGSWWGTLYAVTTGAMRRLAREVRAHYPSSRSVCVTASATFTPMSMQVRFVFALGISGMIDASAT